jgi:hypothetical protein
VADAGSGFVAFAGLSEDGPGRDRTCDLGRIGSHAIGCSCGILLTPALTPSVFSSGNAWDGPWVFSVTNSTPPTIEVLRRLSEPDRNGFGLVSAILGLECLRWAALGCDRSAPQLLHEMLPQLKTCIDARYRRTASGTREGFILSGIAGCSAIGLVNAV